MLFTNFSIKKFFKLRRNLLKEETWKKNGHSFCSSFAMTAGFNYFSTQWRAYRLLETQHCCRIISFATDSRNLEFLRCVLVTESFTCIIQIFMFFLLWNAAAISVKARLDIWYSFATKRASSGVACFLIFLFELKYSWHSWEVDGWL